VTKDYDVIVIGSGIGGLATASLLAQLKKLRVLVLERHFKVGGFTHIFKRKGYTFDVGLHYVGDMGQGSQTRKLFDLATGGAVQWQKMPDIFEKFVYPDFTMNVASNKESYLKELCKFFPEERFALIQYFKDITAVSASINNKIVASTMPGPINTIMDAINFTYKSKGLISTAQYLNAHFENAKLKAVLVSQWGDYGLPPSLSSFAIHSLVANHYLNGAYYPIGSSETIAASIVPIIKQFGGNVLANHNVEEIIVENSTVRGIIARTAQGNINTYKANTIISDAGLNPTYTQLLPEAHRITVPNFTGDIGSSACTLYLGLKRSPKELGFLGENHWLFTDYDHDAAYLAGQSLADKPHFAYLSFASLKDPLASAHTAQIITITSANAFKQWQDTIWKKRGGDYEQLKRQIIEKLLDLTETYYPGFKESVDYSELSTPLTVESFTGHPGGRIYGQPLTPQIMATKSFKPDTHIKNLYLTGADMMAPGIIGAFMGGVVCAARIIGPAGMLKIFAQAETKSVKVNNARSNIQVSSHG